MTAVGEEMQRRYGQWQAPGARYAALARMGLKRSGRLAGVEDDE